MELAALKAKSLGNWNRLMRRCAGWIDPCPTPYGNLKSLRDVLEISLAVMPSGNLFYARELAGNAGKIGKATVASNKRKVTLVAHDMEERIGMDEIFDGGSNVPLPGIPSFSEQSGDALLESDQVFGIDLCIGRRQRSC